MTKSRASLRPAANAMNGIIDYVSRVLNPDLPEAIEIGEGISEDDVRAKAEEYNRKIEQLRVLREIPLPEKFMDVPDLEEIVGQLERELKRQGNIEAKGLRVIQGPNGICLIRDE